MLAPSLASIKHADAVNCASGAAAQNGITVAPSHGQAFYVDFSPSGQGKVLDAGYMGYKITNQTGISRSALWTEVSSFTGGVLSLVNSADSAMKLPTLANNATGTSYFMLKATGESQVAQSHTVKVYNGRPGLSGSTVLYTCTFSFSSVVNTLTASANKIANTGLGTNAAIEVSTTTPELGRTFVVTVEGQTGTIGAGAAPDNSIIWLAPSAISSWPTLALRLESVSAIFDKNANWNNNPVGDQLTYTDQLLIDNAATAIGTAEYRATYTYRVVGRTNQPVEIVPASQIASGTQIKHTDVGGNGTTLTVNFSSFAQNTFLTKSVTQTTGLTSINCTNSCVVPGFTRNTRYTVVPYKLEATTTSATNITLDEFIDVPGSGAIFVPGSAKVTDVGRTNVVLPDAALLSSESGLSPQPYHFDGPFVLNSTRSAVVTYSMYLKSGTYVNQGYAKLSSTDIGNTISSYSTTTVTSNGQTSITYNSGSIPFTITAITNPATNISINGATLNGTVDPNGNSPLTATFEYGTDPALVGATTVTATTPASGNIGGLFGNTAVTVNITDLTDGTTYYFRVKAGSAQGQIRSFVTPVQVLPPTPIADPATAVSLTGATFNGQVNPNNSSVTAVQFVYGTNSNLPNGSSTFVTLDNGSSAPLTLGGNTTQPVSRVITGLTGGNTYYYKVRACTGALTGAFPNISCSTFVDSNIVSFVTAIAPEVVTKPATDIGATSAQLNGEVNPNFADTTVYFEYSTDPNLLTDVSSHNDGVISGSTFITYNHIVVGLLPETTYYFRALATNSSGSDTGEILSFTTLQINRTLAFDPLSYLPTYNYTDVPPTVVAIPSEGPGRVVYDSETPEVCTVDPDTGVVTFITYGTCTLSAFIDASGGYSDASAEFISFEILPVERTLTIDPESYGPSYFISDVTPTITATPSAGAGDITFYSQTEDICTIHPTAGKVSFVTTGTCIIYADITIDRGYLAAIANSIQFEITYVSRFLYIEENSFTASYSYFGTPPTIVATPSAGEGEITYSSLTPDVCTIDSITGEVTFHGLGTCEISANITNDGVYDSATSEKISFEIYGLERTLSIDPASYAPNYLFTDIPPIIVATPSAGAGQITYQSLDEDVCEIDAATGLVDFISALVCQIGAEIEEFNGYYAATATPINFTITPISRTLTINPESYVSRYSLIGDEPIITATPSAGAGTLTFTSYTPEVCTISSRSGRVRFVTVGTCEIGAQINNYPGYNDATATNITFNIVNLQNRTLTIDPSSYTNSYELNQNPPMITSTPSAGGGTKTYTSLTTRICSTNSATGKVRFLRTGTCEIGAEIAEDENYNSATADTISFTLTQPPRTVRTGGVVGQRSTSPASTDMMLDMGGNNEDGSAENAEEFKELCTPYLTKFIRLGSNNDPAEVTKLQFFLNQYEGERLVIDGVYKQVDYQAVLRFQTKYAEILRTWNLTAPTGYVYTATQETINRLYCERNGKLVCPYFTGYHQLGSDDAEIPRIKTFLNNQLGTFLNAASTIFDQGLFTAVKEFQNRNASRILTPWGLTAPTGRWYQSTRKIANDIIGCTESVILDNGVLLSN